MAFDWVRLLSAQGVAFVTRGPNTARGHISVKCPWCGEADPSQHLGIDLKGNRWGCLRNRGHRGRSRSRLIQALLRCSSERARHLAGEEALAAPPPDEDFGARIRALVGVTAPEADKQLKLAPEFKPLRLEASALPFWNYLRERGYTDTGIEWLAKTYNLHYARSGEFRYRVIVPVYDRHNCLMSWTGRTVSTTTELRYKALDRERSIRPAKELLLGLPYLWSCVNPEVLVIVEGPFDAFRITSLGHQRGVYGTCLFGLEVSNNQVELLEGLAGRFARLILLLDPEEHWAPFHFIDRLVGLGVRRGTLPEGVEDPGTLRPREAAALMQSWLT